MPYFHVSQTSKKAIEPKFCKKVEMFRGLIAGERKGSESPRVSDFRTY